VSGLCYHKHVLPIEGPEWGGYSLIMVLMGLCNVAGIGGGAINQPIIQYFFKFEIKESIALSDMIILCGSLTRFIYTLRMKNPIKPKTPLVDYSLATIMISTALAGS